MIIIPDNFAKGAKEPELLSCMYRYDKAKCHGRYPGLGPDIHLWANFVLSFQCDSFDMAPHVPFSLDLEPAEVTIQPACAGEKEKY
jgi:hypothetical protein